MRRNVLLRLSSIAGLCLFTFAAHSQSSCGFDAYHQAQLQSDPKFKSKLDAFEKFWQDKQELLMNTAARVVVSGTDTTYEVPVVFHVIHTGSAIGTNFNPTDTRIQNVVAYLNQTYAATWPGYATTATGGTNIPLRFVLAKRDSLCNATTGINRINGVTALGGATGTTYNDFGVARTTSNGITDAQLKAIVQWNPANYYNIWVVNKIDGWSGYVAGSGVVGYAQFAGGPIASDGTVIMEAFNDQGQTTLPHELGHAFNLYHTFEGGCVAASGCATNGDMVCDTDPHAQGSGCPTGTNPCTNTSWLPVTYNIMNYTNCTDRFSAGQNARIKSAIFYGRGSLVQSLGGTAPGGQTTYTLPVALSGCATPGIANASNTNDVGPSSIKIADMQSFSSGYTTDGAVYMDRTAPSCTQAAVAPAHMTAGQSYAVTVGTGYNPENVKVFIDFNNSGSFTAASETVFSSSGTVSDQYRIHSGNTITIPSTGVVYNTPLRMRVISDFYANNTMAPCGSNLMYGQAEDFTVIIGSNPLPITISKIEAKPDADHKSIDVQWSIEEEHNADHYDIESSIDGSSFARIGNQNPAGDHSQYRFKDIYPLKDQLNFYRLKMVSRDNSFVYSKIVTASVSGKEIADVQLYPNPASDVLNIVIPASGTYDLVVSNALGQSVYTRKALQLTSGTPETVILKGADFAAGIYQLKLTGKSGLTYNGKFVKQ